MMGILDELRQEAETKRQAESTRAREREIIDARYREEFLPKMQKLYLYLKELVGYLNYVNQELLVDNYDDGRRGLVGLRQENYTLSSDEHGGQQDLAHLDTIILGFRCSRPGDQHYLLQGNQEIEKEMHTLSEAGISYTHQPRVDKSERERLEEFIVRRSVPVYFEFRSDAEHMTLMLTVRNHHRLGTYRYVFHADQIDDRFMESLSAYILRRDDSFLRTELSEDERARLRLKLLEDKQVDGRISNDEKQELRQLQKQLGSGGSWLSRLFGK